MKRWLLDIVVCPVIECRSKLQLDVYKTHDIEIEGDRVEEIDEALLTCPKCNRWYPVIDGISCMLPDENRLKNEVQKRAETAFLNRWKDRVPTEILENGIPFGIVPET
jgi:uncharacterized protein YbaR (Trm112 family)